MPIERSDVDDDAARVDGPAKHPERCGIEEHYNPAEQMNRVRRRQQIYKRTAGARVYPA